MSQTFVLQVSGLCAFVPYGEQMRIALVNARDFDHKGGELEANVDNSERHYPVLVTPKKFATSQGRKWGFEFYNWRICPEPLVAYPLDGDDLTVRHVTGSAVTVPDKVTQCPDDDNYRELGWIARMVDLGVGRVSAQAHQPLVTGGVKQTDLVLARLTVSAGELTTFAFARDNYREEEDDDEERSDIVWWTYTTHDGGELPYYRRRALAEVISVAIEVSDSFAVVLEPVSGESEPIVLDGGGEGVLAYLFNTPLPDLLDDDLPESPRPWDHHFLHFYRLAEPIADDEPTDDGEVEHVANRHGAAPAEASARHADDSLKYAPQSLPEPEYTCEDVPTGNLGGPKCPPAYFES